MKKFIFTLFAFVLCFYQTTAPVEASREAKGPSADSLRSLDRAGSKSGRFHTITNDEDDPFLDGLSGKGYGSPKNKKDEPKKEDETNFPPKGTPAKDGDIDYGVGVDFETFQGVGKIKKPALTLDDPVETPSEFDPDAVKNAKQVKEKAGDFNYDAGVNFETFQGQGKVKSPPLTFEDPVNPPSSDYDAAEDTAPQGEFGDGEEIL